MSADRAIWSGVGSSLVLVLALAAACSYPRPPDVGDDDVGCASDQSCGGSTPFCVDHVCAVCKASANCPAGRPVCDATSHDCRSCARDSECDSGACDLAAGRCVDPGAILYASPSGLTADPCTRSAPCSVEKASSAVDSNHSYIVLLPGVHTTSYAFFDSQKATVCGGGATIAGGVLQHGSVVAMRNMKVVEIVNLSAFGAGTAFLANDSDLTLDDVDIFVTSLDAIDGGRVLTLRNTTANGRISTGAHMIVDRSTFLPGSSISLFGTNPSLEVTNSVFVTTVGDRSIAINDGTPGSTAPGSAAVFNNTFIGGGIGCSGSATYGKNFNSNIFYNVGSVQTEPGCRYNHNLIVPFSDYGGTGNITGDPLFVNPASNDFHLRAGSPAIDAADPALVNGHDRDGHARPQDARSDIGAFEYRP